MKTGLAALDTLTDVMLGYRPRPLATQKKLATAKAPRAAEFFAGIGLVRSALEQEGFRVVFANDIEPAKAKLYAANFNAADFVLGDVRRVSGSSIPDIELATASFPCTDLSLAGNRVGLSGKQSGMFWEFARVIEEMGKRRPPVVLLENVLGFASSHNGKDMADAIARLNSLGYRCDVLVVDASWFLPQSRTRMFIVGSSLPSTWGGVGRESSLRPAWVGDFVKSHPELAMHAMPLEDPTRTETTIADYVERMHHVDVRWWDAARRGRFLRSLSPLQAARIKALRSGTRLSWATAYRRTRGGVAVWEIRADSISGCLRTARGGSSKQAVVEAGRDDVRVRWMTAVEYARLQGAPDFKLDSAKENAAMFGFGDAVCVPAVAWIARSYLRPLLNGTWKSR